MAELTLDSLRRILVTCAGESDTDGMGDETLDLSFQDLGYDSLALMEAAAVIEREYGVALSDEVVATVPTPRALLDLVNESSQNAA
ncbi:MULTISPECIES: acyl carrier protein [Streptomyces]|uniref:ActI ORF3 n=1 Tax=Streptomyces chartreusis NRRL 3882 TaxID=1079985 RepID=A0A2N9B388_STRCX|nr:MULTISPECIES: acyl carrier protein [Streptomyces]MYS89686.1 actinorhodin polyketide synthase [Streptomyces sp. SID5464]SOR77811.1 actI ORF3 [Streptomyces chartreusis NRRL 3882]